MEKIVCFVDNEFHTPLCNLCLNNQPLQMLVRLVFNPISLKAKGLKVQIKLIAVRVVDIKTIIMVLASGRWLGVRLDLLSALLTGAVALAAVLVSQDAGR